MESRLATVEATRGRIVAAAMRLHADRGSRATSWEDIAREAGVARATMYHHFPSLDSLIPACAQAAFDLIEIPTPEQAAARFAGMRTTAERLEVFVTETCRCYAAGAGWLRAAWRERDLVPAMGEAVGRLQLALLVLLYAVLGGESLADPARRTLGALLDFPFWDALDRAGVSRDEIPARILRLANGEIENGRMR
jgi:AcrR family transcriptional regulator